MPIYQAVPPAILPTALPISAGMSVRRFQTQWWDNGATSTIARESNVRLTATELAEPPLINRRELLVYSRGRHVG